MNDDKAVKQVDIDDIKAELRAHGIDANVKWSMRRQGLIEINVYTKDPAKLKWLETYLEGLKASGCNFIGG